MSATYDVIVVGVGAMGAATCWQLARRGARVLGLEQFDLPHTRGSSHGYSRVTRTAYYEHPDYVPLLRRSHALWAELERETEEKILHLVGGLYLGRPQSELVAGSLQAARQHALPHQLLEHGALSRRFPQFTVPEDWIAVFEPDAGYLLPELAIASFVTAALRRGATIHGHEEVLSWQPDAAGVNVSTTRGSYRAAQVVFCGGAWSSQLVRDLGLPLVVTRQVMAWVWPRTPALFEPGSFPVWMIDRPAGGVYYGFPLTTLSPGLKIALHAPLQPADPNRVERGIQPEDEETFRPCLRQFLPEADGPLLALRTCLYTNSPDAHFILDRHPRHARVWLAAGFSGHGFKFATVIGEALADFALCGTSALPIGFLGLKRFGEKPLSRIT
ncbi:MAG TPA: N-methyl-L-tryptophan oxidase [Opitutaceae bacterium]|nr:N-methyl-L-tryptophan oxidase [Opitutaceae bacterium]